MITVLSLQGYVWPICVYVLRIHQVLTQTNDVLTQTNDVLTQTNDILTQTNDVLTQTNDVTNSGVVFVTFIEIWYPKTTMIDFCFVKNFERLYF